MKKVLSIALAGALVCTGTASVWAANASKQELKLREAKLFTDAVKTTEDGKFTKGEAVAMVLGALGYKEDVNTKEDYIKLNPFADASNSEALTGNFDNYSIMMTLLGKANEILTGDAYKNMEADLIKTAKESLAAEDAAMVEAGLKQASSMAGMVGN